MYYIYIYTHMYTYYDLTHYMISTLSMSYYIIVCQHALLLIYPSRL